MTAGRVRAGVHLLTAGLLLTCGTACRIIVQNHYSVFGAPNVEAIAPEAAGGLSAALIGGLVVAAIAVGVAGGWLARHLARRRVERTQPEAEPVASAAAEERRD